jgi:hypothetical protein
MSPSLFARLHAARYDHIGDIRATTAQNLKLPCKLQSRRVQAHLRAVLISIRRVNIQPGLVARDAVRAPNIREIDWCVLDLYTVAMDLAEDDELRVLVSQARTMILSELVTRSECRRSSASRGS